MNQALIDKYIGGRLSEKEAEEFEAYCVANPAFAKQVEYEQLLKAGMAQVVRGSNTEFERTGNSWRWKLALAASLVLGFGFVLYSWSPFNGGSPPSILASLSEDLPRTSAAMRLAMVRGADAPPALPQGHVRVEIVGLFDQQAEYSVALERLGQEGVHTIATLDGQRASSPVTLQVVIESDVLEPGAYSLRVRRQDSADEPLDFGFVKNKN